MRGSSPVTERAFHFEDSYVLLANDSKRNTMRGSSLRHNLICPTKRRQIQCTLTRDPRLGWCILVSSKEKEAACLNNGQQHCKVQPKDDYSNAAIGELEETSAQSERTESSLEPEAELQSGELCSVK
ncbi:hypothetical protein PROFUN_16868 [Planoprotostelium fungivorum]|uniref:Uncharacterized protein n=1 Tax=Planoprotostelium fungivorum TaxID=1890364 RepID=A0A2P6MNI4_9EUKA|nr:hypothetical protein PROFUN_16868 [Planoprotostelium fungivorum]